MIPTPEATAQRHAGVLGGTAKADIMAPATAAALINRICFQILRESNFMTAPKIAPKRP
jgi:hypothetical protein